MNLKTVQNYKWYDMCIIISSHFFETKFIIPFQFFTFFLQQQIFSFIIFLYYYVFIRTKHIYWGPVCCHNDFIYLLQFPNHNLTVEASSPALFVDHNGNYWDVPFTLAVDLASVASDSGTSCHFCINRSTGSPKQCEGQLKSPVPPSLLPGLCAKCAVCLKKNFYLWRSEAPKTRMVQPYDMLLSNPHISASAILGNYNFL